MHITIQTTTTQLSYFKKCKNIIQQLQHVELSIRRRKLGLKECGVVVVVVAAKRHRQKIWPHFKRIVLFL